MLDAKHEVDRLARSAETIALNVRKAGNKPPEAALDRAVFDLSGWANACNEKVSVIPAVQRNKFKPVTIAARAFTPRPAHNHCLFLMTHNGLFSFTKMALGELATYCRKTRQQGVPQGDDAGPAALGTGARRLRIASCGFRQISAPIPLRKTEFMIAWSLLSEPPAAPLGRPEPDGHKTMRFSTGGATSR